MELSHVNREGEANMVDISGKAVVKRIAIASGKIQLQPKTMDLLGKGLLEKGDVLSCARIAGISAAKKTSDLIPLCHNIPIDKISVDFVPKEDGIEILASATCTAKTGIEMEALTAVSVAALTLYDMCKAADKAMVITNIHLLEKNKETP